MYKFITLLNPTVKIKLQSSFLTQLSNRLASAGYLVPINKNVIISKLYQKFTGEYKI